MALGMGKDFRSAGIAERPECKPSDAGGGSCRDGCRCIAKRGSGDGCVGVIEKKGYAAQQTTRLLRKYRNHAGATRIEVWRLFSERGATGSAGTFEP